MVVGVWPMAGFDRILHYRLPAHLIGSAEVGILVRIPILNRHSIGVICEVDSIPDVSREKLKLVTEVIYPMPVLTPELMKLTEWMGRYYGASRESIIEAMIPKAVRAGHGAKTESFVSLTRDFTEEEWEKLGRRSPKQCQLCRFLSAQIHPVQRSLILKRLGIAASVCRAAIARGLITDEARVESRTAYDDGFGAVEVIGDQRIVLNREQAVAAKRVSEDLKTGRFVVDLLCGVTGSGKTEVYMQALDEVLASGGGAIILVPEIALTPQTVGRLRARLEREGRTQAVVWHSFLSDGQRLDAWLAIARGEARVVVGARSAVFAPIPNLRLIVVDEEHEPAYKQDDTPRYHGRDVAVYRASLNQAVCLLGSATPSLESFLNAKSGKYRMIRLTRRVDDRKLPYIHIIDMRRELLKKRGAVTLSEILVSKLQERFAAREQSILFLNRRGYSSSMVCRECGYVAECEHCSVTQTYHRTDETLRCHLCGVTKDAPLRCPQCRSEQIRWRGLGTQRVEEAVKRVLRGARVVRMDADAMSRKNLFRQILSDFRLGRIDVLVGTQMIAKGLDFPNVTLVGLVDADLSLHIPDFRAHERTFQLLVQVAGRSGRGDVAGEVVVQTFTPHAMPIQFSRQADVDAFLDEEATARERFGYPPYRHLVQHLFRGRNPDKVAFVAEQWVKQLSGHLPEDVELRGPAPCATEKIKDRYRFQVWYFTNRVTSLVREIRLLESTFPMPDDVIQVIDVDPMQLV
ncbi:MAG: primosomal protein N' [Verrucomicrobia bacterium]|nr:MAG: primosomal protein N' [Verrucomicrobiota bacterium]